MKKLILLTSLTTLFVVLTTPALAQEANPQPNATTDQYGQSGPVTTTQQAAEAAVDSIVRRGEDADGAAAYGAALNAAREAGADEETAETVAAQAVANVSEKPENRKPSDKEKPENREPSDKEKPEITELPATGGAPSFAVGAGLLIASAGLLVRRLF